MPLAFARSVLAGGSKKELTLSRTATSINEGQSVTFNIQSVGLEGESVPYTVSGISQADLSSGSVSASNIGINSNGLGSVAFTLANDLTTEGTETLTLTLGSEYQEYADENGYQQSVTINDTSLSPTVSSVSRSTVTVNEGASATFTVNTSNMVSGSRVYYRFTGITDADFSSNPSSSTGSISYSAGSISSEAGYITVNGSNQATITVNMAADVTTEGQETMYFRVTRLANSSGTTLVNNTASTFMYVADTSAAPPTGGYFLRATSNADATGTYTIPANVTAISVMGVGAGGGGAGWANSSRSGGGGAGGSTGIIGYMQVSPGQVYNFQAGGKGLGGYMNTGSAGGHTRFKSPSNTDIMYCYGGSGGRVSQGQNISSIKAEGGNTAFYTSNAPFGASTILQTNAGYGGGDGGQGRNGWGGGGGGAGSVRLYTNTGYPTGGYVGQGAFSIGQVGVHGHGGGGGGGYGAFSTGNIGGQGGDIGFVAMPGPTITEGQRGVNAGQAGGNGPSGSSIQVAQYGGGGGGGGGGTSGGNSGLNGEEGAIYLVHGGSNDLNSASRKKWPDNPF